MTAASARPGLPVDPVQHFSSSLSSRYGAGLSPAAGAPLGSPSDGAEQYMDRRLDSLDHFSPNEGVDLTTSLIDMGFVCLYRSGRIGQAHRLLDQLASSRHLMRSDLLNALFVSIQHEIALEFSPNKGFVENGGSIVLADDEGGLVVTIELRRGGSHAKYWRTSKIGENDLFEVGRSAHSPSIVMGDDFEHSLERILFSKQPGRFYYPSLCQGKGAPDGDMNLHTWAFFVLGLGTISFLLAFSFGML